MKGKMRQTVGSCRIGTSQFTKQRQETERVLKVIAAEGKWVGELQGGTPSATTVSPGYNELCFSEICLITRLPHFLNCFCIQIMRFLPIASLIHSPTSSYNIVLFQGPRQQ